ncbi:hypothetical protein GGX14DRAFT_391751 [Mycena pura]|uniref:Uncharacterized protein n=1 Tax=Mycena pura TaxID=153505 RepID=A0AAD6YGP4_9AGAR|nr:hypothetical protein GGX14DRAFT_391751 [Mycena pura]
MSNAPPPPAVPQIIFHYCVHDEHHAFGRFWGTLTIDEPAFRAMLVSELMRIAQHHHRNVPRGCSGCPAGQAVLLKSAWLVAVPLKEFVACDVDLPALPLRHKAESKLMSAFSSVQEAELPGSDENHIRVVF